MGESRAGVATPRPRLQGIAAALAAAVCFAVLAHDSVDHAAAAPDVRGGPSQPMVGGSVPGDLHKRKTDKHRADFDICKRACTLRDGINCCAIKGWAGAQTTASNAKH